MSGTKICLSGLVVALLGLGDLHGQDLSARPSMSGVALPGQLPGVASGGQASESPPGTAPLGPMMPSTTPALGEPSAGTLPSSWMLYSKSPGCCGALCDGPVTWEIFLRSGVSFQVSSGPLTTALTRGWDIEGGGRTLFYNPQTDAAWTATLSLSNINYPSSSHPVTVQHNFFTTTSGVTTETTSPVTLGSLNRTFFNYGGGYLWYLKGNGSQLDGCSWRAGAEFGGRWGSDKEDYVGMIHDTKDSVGVWGALYTDVEVPFNGAWLQVGIRLEADAIWSDILQHQNDANVQDINLLIYGGIRF